MPSDSANDNLDAEFDLDEEAAHWVVRLQADDVTPKDLDAFERWLTTGNAHAEAFRRARDVWAGLGNVSEERITAQAQTTEPARRPRRRRTAYTALAASILFIIAFGAWHQDSLTTILRADYSTNHGEIREATLPDGSVVLLNSDSAIEIGYDDGLRRVTLLKGEAAFDVAPVGEAGNRPFVVEAFGGTARAMGTRFLVRIADGQAQVSVEQHRVAVTAPPNGTGPSIELGEGESVTYTAAGVLGNVDQIDETGAGTWRSGRLIFNQRSLAEVITELNRYRPGRIVIAREPLAARRVSGIFYIDDLSEAVDVIADELGASVVSVPGIVTLLY